MLHTRLCHMDCIYMHYEYCVVNSFMLYGRQCACFRACNSAAGRNMDVVTQAPLSEPERRAFGAVASDDRLTGQRWPLRRPQMT